MSGEGRCWRLLVRRFRFPAPALSAVYGPVTGTADDLPLPRPPPSPAHRRAASIAGKGWGRADDGRTGRGAAPPPARAIDPRSAHAAVGTAEPVVISRGPPARIAFSRTGAVLAGGVRVRWPELLTSPTPSGSRPAGRQLRPDQVCWRRPPPPLT